MVSSPSPSPESLQWYDTGVQAFQSKQYPEAIHYLQTFTQLCIDEGQMESQSFGQTQMILVQCYHATQQLEAAIALCEWCTQHPDLADWAHKTLATLQATPIAAPVAPSPVTSPPPESSKPKSAPQPEPQPESSPEPPALVDSTVENPSLLEAGVGANRRGNHEEAVRLLNQYLGVDLPETSQKFMKAQMTLIKSYLALEQKENAIDRCRQLQNTPNAALKIWINKTLGSLVSPEELHAVPKPAPQASAPNPSQDNPPSETPNQPSASSSKQTITIAASSRSTPSSSVSSSSASSGNVSSSSTSRTVVSSSPSTASTSSRKPVSSAASSRSSTGFSSDELLPLIGAFVLTLIFCFLGFNTFLGFFGRIIFFVAIAFGVGTATQGIEKVIPTGIGLLVLSLIPFIGISFHYFIGWAIGATVMSFLRSVNNRDGLIDLVNPKSIRMAIALGLGFLIAVTPSVLGIGGSSEIGSNLAVEVGPVTPLHSAAGQGDVNQVKTLLAASPDVNAVNARDAAGRTPLYWAVSGCVWDTLDEFSESYQCTPTPTHLEVVNLLVAAGAEVNAVDVNADTPLHWAVEWGSPQTVQVLLTYKANPNPVESFYSPLELAEDRGDPAIIQALKQYGAQ